MEHTNASNEREMLHVQTTMLKRKRNESFTDGLPTTNQNEGYSPISPATDEVPSASSSEIIIEEKPQIPDYLLSSNRLFEKTMKNTIKSELTNDDIDKLRSIAILVHEKRVIDLKIQFWAAFIKTERETSTEWPVSIKSMILLAMKNLTHLAPMDLHQMTKKVCLEIVFAQIAQLENQKNQCHTLLNVQKQQFQNDQLNTIESSIEIFIEQQLHHLEDEYASKIASIEYEYQQERLQRDLVKELSNYQQFQIIEHLCSCKHALETSKYELVLLKQYRQQQKFPPMLNASNISIPSFIFFIREHENRQKLLDEHKKLAKKYRLEMLNQLITISEENILKMQAIFDQDVNRMFPSEKHSSNVFTLLQQRFVNITTEVERVHRRKMHECFGAISTIVLE